MTVSADALAEAMLDYTSLVEHSLQRYLGESLLGPARLREAMRYSVFGGGKRLRPVLVLLACDACSGMVDKAIPAACAVEMLHTYSLIHDDLPAMDDDEYRRGQPTCHRKFDVATAILAGDALQALAFEVLCDLKPSSVAIRCVRELSVAAGTTGMVGGQIDDLNPPSARGNLEWVQSLHSRKTGALLLACLRMGGAVAEATEEQTAALSEYGRRVGLAFQIADDLLDVEGDPQRMGKGSGKDTVAGKFTYPGLLGVEESRRLARELVQEAVEHLRPLGPKAAKLRTLASYVIERDR